jgi:hypothetical protein
MVSQELIDYIKTNLNRRYSIEQIKRTLIQHGYKEDELEETIRMVYSEKTPSAKKPEEKKVTKGGDLAKASIINTIGVFLFPNLLVFTYQLIPLETISLLVAILIPMALFWISWKKFKEVYWKSFIIGIIIGFILFFVFLWFVWAPLQLWYLSEHGEEILNQSSTLIQTGPKKLEIYEKGSVCGDGNAMIAVKNKYKEPIKVSDVQIIQTQGTCSSGPEIDFTEFPANYLDTKFIFFKGCTLGENTFEFRVSEGETTTVTINCVEM